MDRKVITRPDGLELSYLTAGQGQPVLLLHGFSMWSEIWIDNGVAKALCRYRVLLPDVMGHGRSGRPHDAASYGARLTLDVVNLLDLEGIVAAHVIGFSMGAEIGLRLAAEHPERVASLLMIGSGWTPAEGGDLYQASASRARAAESLLTPDPDLDALDAVARGMPEIIDVAADRVAGLAMPLAGIVGEEDPEKPYLERVQRALPGFALDVLPGVAHAATWRDLSLPGRIARFVDTAGQRRPQLVH